ncbi:DUF6443 domain-containing protein [Jejuia pallidilutea]|uniref:DUF6443 domain-containing protein n=1 Tax=Jejuia pallidilutea TaxID=504487 RepID=UPI001FD1F52B|nr:DUF6443 domain-containing protein [Jejuia pallidilutea]
MKPGSYHVVSLANDAPVLPSMTLGFLNLKNGSTEYNTSVKVSLSSNAIFFEHTAGNNGQLYTSVITTFQVNLATLGGGNPTSLSDENYVYTIVPQSPVKTDTELHGLNGDEKIESVTYFDGLGRSMQNVGIRAGGNGEDIVTHIAYDAYGRQDKEYLPYAINSTGGMYQSTAETATKDYYYNATRFADDFTGLTQTTVNPYSEKNLESSPLNRVLEQGAPGTDWALDKNADTDHTIKFGYAANTSNEVIYFDTEFVGGDTESPKLVLTNSHYNEGELYKTITKDENWRTYEKKDRTTEEFKDKQGRVVLKRTYDNQQAHDTHYVYDDFGNLTYVLPPLASQKTVFYEVGMINIPANSLVTGGSPTGSISIGIEKTGTNTYQFVGDIDLHNLGNSTFINGEIIDIPNLDPSLGSYINLGGVYQYDYNNDMDWTRSVRYYISNGKLYCSSYSYSYNYNTDEETNDISGANFPDITDIDNTKTLSLSNTLEGITEAETQANVQEVLDRLCYQYKYDSRNRLIEKKIPGKAWEYIVYDKLDRPVLTQDANLRADNKWLFTKYDVFGRVVYTGIYTHASLQDQNQMQGNLHTFYTTNTSNNLYESKQNAEGSYHYYSNQSFPNANMEILTVNYYDDYTFDKAGGNSETSYGITPITNVKGLATGSKVKVLTTNDWITSVTYYDAKSRPIFVYSFNDYLNTTDIVKNKLDFTGKVEEAKTVHQIIGHNKITTIDIFEYDHTGRLISQKQNINNQGEELIAKNHYDELGQLIKKDIGDIESNPLQEVDYTYNIRGWLKELNNPNWGELGDDLFTFRLGYNDLGTRLYNGNISQVEWTTSNDENSRRYNYYYDDLNRLKNAYFYEWSKNYRFNTYLNYDRNGNIISLSRGGHIVENPDYGSNTDYGTMDNLSYYYNGNQLHSVTDASGVTTGFKDGNASDAIYDNGDDDYSYDADGNMIEDKNKGITNIVYNHLNLPKDISINGNGNSGTISYIYDATGVKLKKEVSLGTNTLYAGNYIYEGASGNETLKFFNHPEGYVDASGSGYEYIYQYKDHLGNVRLSYKENTNFQQVQEVWSDGYESASGWDGSGNSWGTAISAFDSTFKRTGNYSGRLDANETTSSATAVHSNHWENINISEPTYYTVSAWVYLEDVTDNFAGIYLFMKTNAETGYYTEIITTSTRTLGQWVQLKKSVLVPPHIDKLNVRIDNRYAGKVWFDDVQILEGNTLRTEIVEENNYYPFGLEHKGYNNVVQGDEHPFKYNGMEYNEELGLDWYDFGARNYDPYLGRWMSIDPLAEIMESESPFNYGYNNPIYYRDFDGRAPKGMLDPYLVFDGQKNKLYIYDDNDTPDDPSDDVLIGTFDAHNLTIRDSQGKWEDGTYNMLDKKTRWTHTTLETKGKWAFERLLDSPNSSYGAGGIYRATSFRQTDGKKRGGMAIHAGREDRPFLTRKTKGCIRVYPEAMVAIDNAIIEFGSLTSITVKNNKSQKQRDPVSAVSTLTPSPIVPIPVPGPTPTPIVPVVPGPTPTPDPKPLPVIIPKPPIKT